MLPSHMISKTLFFPTQLKKKQVICPMCDRVLVRLRRHLQLSGSVGHGLTDKKLLDRLVREAKGNNLVHLIMGCSGISIVVALCAKHR